MKVLRSFMVDTINMSFLCFGKIRIILIDGNNLNIPTFQKKGKE